MVKRIVGHDWVERKHKQILGWVCGISSVEVKGYSYVRHGHIWILTLLHFALESVGRIGTDWLILNEISVHQLLQILGIYILSKRKAWFGIKMDCILKVHINHSE